MDIGDGDPPWSYWRRIKVNSACEDEGEGEDAEEGGRVFV